LIINGFICEGPKCDKLKGQRVVIQWDADGVKENPETMPDQFFRFGFWQPSYEEPKPGRSEQPRVHQFCSTGCTIDYLRHVDPPMSPREQAAIVKNNLEVEAKKKQMELPLEEPTAG
jgi:hypothetical protein